MKSKRLFQIFVLLALLFSPFGNDQQVRARADAVDKLDIQIVEPNFPGLQDIMQVQPTLSMAISPPSINIDGTATVTVNLNNVPAEGYTSAEFTCTYDPNLVEASNIVIGNLFGTDPATTINGPHAGRFIVAIAGSDGNKATDSGTVIAFNVRGLQPGQTPLECQGRVSKGDNTLTDIASTGNNVIVVGPTPTPTIKPAACDKAEFIADINVPPGTVMSPGAGFIKTWRLKNVGSCVWTTSYRIAFFSGEQMGALSSIRLPVNVAPGQMVDLSLNMTAPSVPGSYRGYWIFQNANGALFGVGPQGNEPWFVDIVVANATVTPTSTFTQSPTATPNEPTITQTPTLSITPGGPTAAPIPGVVYDFAANACTATWFSGAGQLPCPGIDGDPKGFVLRLSNPQLETGATDPRPGLLTFPQNVQNGYIQGVYPPYHVQNGDRFRSTIGCEGGATSCYVAFRLDYQIGSDPIRTFWGPWLERYEGKNYSADIDLSPLAGKDVKFILTVLSAGNATGDRALWVGPIIYRAGSGLTPTSEVSLTPTIEVSPTFTPTSTMEGGWLTPTELTGTPMPAVGLLMGKVLASKLVRIEAYNAEAILVGAGWTNPDGSFEFYAPSGTNSVIASASGFLSAERLVTVTDGSSTTLPTITLIAGDIDQNNVIDQFDALTIGMSYNTAAPSEADLNNDGIINVLDLELLATNYRKTGPIAWQ
jgi:hypothetical protein